VKHLVCVYKISICDYVYFGSTMCFDNRKRQHLYELKRNRHGNPFMQKAFNKYNDIKFDIMQVVDEQEVLAVEQMFIDEHYGKKECMNIASVAGSRRGVPHSEETKHKLSIAHKGRKLTPEQVAAVKKRGVSPQFRTAANDTARNRSLETREKIRQNMTGNIVSTKTRNKIRESVGRLTWNDVCQIRLDWVVGGVTQGQLAECYGVCQSNISQIVNRKKWVTI
jgi:group I intron endonuclease